MKKLARKFLAMLLTAAIAVSGLVVTTVTAGAESIADKAIELEAMEIVSKQFEENGESEYYQITVPKTGTITLRFNFIKAGIDWSLMDSNGTEVGYVHSHSIDNTNEITKIENLNKGIYYLCVVNTADMWTERYIKDLSYSFTPAQKATVSISTTIKKGTTLQLGSVTENYDGKVTWLSTKKSVATVSDKGLVTAKKAGTTYIRAQLDNGDYVEIKVVVKKK